MCRRSLGRIVPPLCRDGTKSPAEAGLIEIGPQAVHERSSLKLSREHLMSGTVLPRKPRVPDIRMPSPGTHFSLEH